MIVSSFAVGWGDLRIRRRRFVVRGHGGSGGAARCGGQASGLPATLPGGGPWRLAGPRVARAPSRSDAEGALDLGGTAPQAARHRRRHPQKRHKSRRPGGPGAELGLRATGDVGGAAPPVRSLAGKGTSSTLD